LDVQIISDLPSAFLANRIGSDRNRIRPGSFDIGMVQLDSIRVDVDASLARVEQLIARRKELVSQELNFIRTMQFSLVAVDIPAMPLESAALAGIPRLAIGNFGWDWIYSGFVEQNPRWIAAADVFREQYGFADLLLRLPFCEQMTAFHNVEDIGIVAEPGSNRRSEIAVLTGCDPEKKWVLLSFTTLDWNEDALANVEKIGPYEFFTVLPLTWQRHNIHPLDREMVSFSDAIASVDAVISKPGFGILSDCIVNDKPLIYADRSDFLEYAILVDALRKYLKNVHIPSEDLYRGDLLQARLWIVAEILQPRIALLKWRVCDYMQTPWERRRLAGSPLRMPCDSDSTKEQRKLA
jgi:L-arabinokinase